MSLIEWLYYKKITIDHTKVDNDLTNFPLLVKLDSTNFDFTHAQSDGSDIRFTSSDGSTLLDYERERHDSTNQVAEYWVKIPTISSTTDTEVYIYYGNTSASDGENATSVWDSDYVGVWHMNQDPSGTAPQILDSTTNNNDGTSNGSMTSSDLVDGKIAKGIAFDGSDDYINCGTNTSLDITANITLEAIIKQDTNDSDKAILSKHGSSGDRTYGLNVEVSSPSKLQFFLYDSAGTTYNVSEISPIDRTNFVYICGKYNGIDMDLFINSSKVNTNNVSITINSNTNPLEISSYYGYTGYEFNGIVDEVRISKIARSDAWIKATYYSDSGQLNSFSSEIINFINQFYQNL